MSRPRTPTSGRRSAPGCATASARTITCSSTSAATGRACPTRTERERVDDALVMHDVERGDRQRQGGCCRTCCSATSSGRRSRQIPSHERAGAGGCLPQRHGDARTVDLGNLSLGVGTGVSKFFSYPGMPRPRREGDARHQGADVRAPRTTPRCRRPRRRDRHRYRARRAVHARRGGRHPGRLARWQAPDRRGSARRGDDVHRRAPDEQSRHHPVADGNERLIRGELALHARCGGAGPDLAIARRRSRARASR